MLNKNDIIRIEKRPQSRHPKWNYLIYFFKCKICPKEFWTKKCYFKRHSGLCKTCSSRRSMLVNGSLCKKRPFEARYNSFISRTKFDLVKTDVTYEDYLAYTKIKNCTYCEETIPWAPYGDNTPGFFLDRKDNNRWHTKDNLTVCCGSCNKTKRDEFTYEEFKIIGLSIKQVKELRNKFK